MSAPTTWTGDWNARILHRIRLTGCRSLVDYLGRHKAVPYVHIAKQLGDDIAAVQVEWAHLGEAIQQGHLRLAAMDSLARDLCAHLPMGWQHGCRNNFETSSAYASWITRLVMAEPKVKPMADGVLDALEASRPPPQWIPSGPDDPIIVSAFERAWPSQASEQP